MPMYEYQCESCEHIEEVLQKVSDPAPEVCPACGKVNSLKKLISQTSFQLKGSGWYKDLYSSAKTEKSAPESKSAETKETPKKTEPKKD